MDRTNCYCRQRFPFVPDTQAKFHHCCRSRYVARPQPLVTWSVSHSALQATCSSILAVGWFNRVSLLHVGDRTNSHGQALVEWRHQRSVRRLALSNPLPSWVHGLNSPQVADTLLDWRSICKRHWTLAWRQTARAASHSKIIPLYNDEHRAWVKPDETETDKKLLEEAEGKVSTSLR